MHGSVSDTCCKGGQQTSSVTWPLQRAQHRKGSGGELNCCLSNLLAMTGSCSRSGRWSLDKQMYANILLGAALCPNSHTAHTVAATHMCQSMFMLVGRAQCTRTQVICMRCIQFAIGGCSIWEAAALRRRALRTFCRGETWGSLRVLTMVLARLGTSTGTAAGCLTAA